jgi:hypothetical protein
MGVFCARGGSPSMSSVGPLGSSWRMVAVSNSAFGTWAMWARVVR